LEAGIDKQNRQHGNDSSSWPQPIKIQVGNNTGTKVIEVDLNNLFLKNIQTGTYIELSKL
jgi:hypothetical protein